MGSTDFLAFSRLAESPQQRNEESGHINEFETIFSLLMQRRFGRELKWDLLIFGLFQGSQNLRNNATRNQDILMNLRQYFHS